ncbi:NAD(P)-dependent oxidoreductase [uncultured Legionella sp.]|uniref:NAD(P)-dependent oxidoreductase n=1 Tax=uncultured Legionella sp. TaxID=210934 RepID=UPI00261FEFFD|nr:NAD(P)-dependent oxidoreductase [uncultured Legionella sp.]
MTQTVYLTNQFIKSIIPQLNPEWTIISGWNPVDAATKHQVTALATTVWDRIDADYLVQFPNLKIITHLGIGTDNIDKDYLMDNDILLLSQPNAGIHDTAELALTLMLTLARKIIPNHKYTKENQWVENKTKFIGNHLQGKHLGLIGFGQIGATIAKFAHALDMKIAYTARNKKDNTYTYYSDINSLANDSDFIIICCSANADSHHLIDKTVLEHLGCDGYLINVARGSIVDENALINALSERTIAGAALDVYSNEPEVSLKLRELDNVVLSPHMGSSTKENLNNMFHLQAQQLNHYLQNLHRLHPVTEPG